MARKEKQYHYIYKTTNLINQKYYIGMHSTDNLEDGYMGSGKRLRRSLKKYGKENFKFEILEFLLNRKLLIEREVELVDEELLRDSLSMNIKNGGEGGFINEEHKTNFILGSKITRHLGGEKIKWLHSNNKQWVTFFSEQIKNGLRKSEFKHDGFLNKTHSEETKRKIADKLSIIQKGENNSQFGTCWITNGINNKKIKKEELNNYLCNGWDKGRNF